eukprot:gene30476-39722_t
MEDIEFRVQIEELKLSLEKQYRQLQTIGPPIHEDSVLQQYLKQIRLSDKNIEKREFSTVEDCIRSSPEYAIDIQKELLKKENTDLKSKCERLAASLRNKDTQMLHAVEKNKELSKSLEAMHKEKQDAAQETKLAEKSKIEALIRSVTAESDLRRSIVTKLQETHDHEVEEIELLISERDAAVERIVELDLEISEIRQVNNVLGQKEIDLTRVVATLKAQLSEVSAAVSAFQIERENNEKLLGRFASSNKQLLAELEQERDITHSLRTMVASLEAADAIAVDKNNAHVSRLGETISKLRSTIEKSTEEQKEREQQQQREKMATHITDPPPTAPYQHALNTKTAADSTTRKRGPTEEGDGVQYVPEKASKFATENRDGHVITPTAATITQQAQSQPQPRGNHLSTVLTPSNPNPPRVKNTACPHCKEAFYGLMLQCVSCGCSHHSACAKKISRTNHALSDASGGTGSATNSGISSGTIPWDPTRFTCATCSPLPCK